MSRADHLIEGAMDAKHTPGPWVAADVDGAGWVDIYTLDEDGYRSLPFAACKHFDVEANAQLIAAAPDMLAALLYYRDECSGAEPSLSVFQRMLDEAIAKATGSAA
jgi:hypothetical protein